VSSAVKVVLVSVLILAPLEPCMAQSWLTRGADARYYAPPGHSARSPRPDDRQKSSKREKKKQANLVKDGGPRPKIAPKIPPIVAFPHSFPVKSIVIDTSRRKLYFVVEEGRAYEYPIAVGRTGFSWTGTEAVSRKRAWPNWRPPAVMRARDPSLPKKMTGGVRNPLGAIALYLGDTEYRIHGTNDPESIGSAQSSGCFRMINSAALHLASLAEVGTTVTVVDALPAKQRSERSDKQANQHN
jgi:lipoprotein-anchoring transpeptidase ErfK/SrfK